MDDKEKNLNNLQNDLNPQNNAGSFPVNNDIDKTNINNRINESRSKNLNNSASEYTNNENNNSEIEKKSELNKNNDLKEEKTSGDSKAKNIGKKIENAAINKVSQNNETVRKTVNTVRTTKEASKIIKAIIKFFTTPVGWATLIAVGLFVLLIIVVTIFQTVISSLSMKFGLTGSESYETFSEKYKEGLGRDEIDKIETEMCKRGFFSYLANSLGIYNLGDSCELSHYVKKALDDKEKETDLKVSPGLFMSTIYYSFETQNIDENGKMFILPKSYDKKNSDGETVTVNDLDAISTLLDVGVYNKNDINMLINYTILDISKYDIKPLTAVYDVDEEGNKLDTFTCETSDNIGVPYSVSNNKFYLLLRYGKDAADYYELDSAKANAYTRTSPECINELSFSKPDMSIYETKYDISDYLIDEDSNNLSKEIVTLITNGETFTYENGFVFSTYPKYKGKYSISGNDETFDYKSEYDIEKIINTIDSRQDYINYLLGYPSSVSSNYSSSQVCTYRVNGTDLTNLKVRLIYAKNDATPNVEIGNPVVGEDLIDFEKYVLGVVHAEIGDGGPEALKVQAILARSIALSVGKIVNEDGQNILEITNSTWDQTYCDPDTGCDICMLPGSSVHSVFTKGTTPNSTYCRNWKSGLSSDSKIRDAARSVNGVTLSDSSGNLYKDVYTIEMQKTWKNYESSGSDYVEIIEKYWNGRYKIDNSECTFGAVGEWASWKQWDSQWGNVLIGHESNDTMAKIGCLLTSYSMVIAKSAPTLLIQNFNPGTYGQAMKDAGALSYGGGIKDYTTPITVATGIQNPNVQVEQLSGAFESKLSRISHYLEEGYDVIIRVRSPQSAIEENSSHDSHYVVVTGMDGNKIYIADPGYRVTEFSENYRNSGLVLLIAIKF